MELWIKEERLGAPIMLNEYDCDGYESLGYDKVCYDVDDEKMVQLIREELGDKTMDLDDVYDYLLNLNKDYLEEYYGDIIRSGKEIERERC